MNILWACIVVVLNNVTVIEVAATREGCEAISRQNPGSSCFPVTVRSKLEATKQIEAINTLIK